MLEDVSGSEAEARAQKTAASVVPEEEELPSVDVGRVRALEILAGRGLEAAAKARVGARPCGAPRAEAGGQGTGLASTRGRGEAAQRELGPASVDPQNCCPGTDFLTAAEELSESVAVPRSGNSNGDAEPERAGTASETRNRSGSRRAAVLGLSLRSVAASGSPCTGQSCPSPLSSKSASRRHRGRER